jgi:hypothetical protein
MITGQRLRILLCVGLLLCARCAGAPASSRAFPLSDKIRSDRFTAALDGQPATVAHAAMSYHFLNFEVSGTGAEVSINASSDDY